ncbi:WD40 repeat domain-containing protein [Caballeronia ptereochthonis]|uniref:WD domain, G-beta repeat n=1 Tax=Caballeronia ptereochthonis TaxID=1777144 RepID=A0A158BKZ6_9BURK|nr:WD40 repeat domain-containing protein [Caballeronia ptereochthonis]SAK69987.1 WD domain, G-beta repeat [Caballeronia ptereochthonis]
MYDPHSAHRVILTVHGIRTYGKWSDRLRMLIHARDPRLPVENYSYGFFSTFALLLPPFRWFAVWRFAKELRSLAGRYRHAQFDIVAHSFGTFIVGKTLKRTASADLPRIGTVIFAGSVLRQTFPWRKIFEKKAVKRVVNECGVDDHVLIISQLFVLFTGMAGRVGFHGFQGNTLRNRYFSGGHSLYFTDEFMSERWIPLLVDEAAASPVDERRELSALSAAAMWLVQNFEPLKIALYIGAPCWLMIWQVDTWNKAYAQEVATRAAALVGPAKASTLDGLALAIESVATKPTKLGLETLERATAMLPDEAYSVRLQANRTSSGAAHATDYDASQGIGPILIGARGNTGLVGTDKGAIVAFDTKNWSVLRAISLGDDPIDVIALDDSGQHAFASDQEGAIALWNPANQSAPVRIAGRGRIFAAGFSGDGKSLCLLSEPEEGGAEMRELDAVSGVQRSATALEPARVTAAAVSPDGTLAATATNRASELTDDVMTPPNAIRLWNTRNGKLIHSFISSGEVTSVSLSPDNLFLAAGDVFGVTQVWSLNDPSPIFQSRQAVPIAFVQFSRFDSPMTMPAELSIKDWMEDQTIETALERGIALYPQIMLASAGKDGTVSIINLVTRKETGLVLQREHVRSVSFSKGDDLLFIGNGSGINAWRTSAFANAEVVLNSPIEAISIGPQSNTILALGSNALYRAWNRNTGRQVVQETLYQPGWRNAPELENSAIAVTPKAITFLGSLASIAPAMVSRWDGVTGTPLPPVRVAALVTRVTVSQDGQRMAVASDDGLIHLYPVLPDPDDPPVTVSTTSSPTAMSLSEDARWLIAGNASGRVDVWDTATLAHRAFQGQGKIVEVAASVESGRFVFADEQGRVVSIDASSGEASTIVADNVPVGSLAFWGKNLLAVSKKTLKVFDLSSRGVLAEREVEGPVRNVVFGHDGYDIYYTVGNKVQQWRWDRQALLRVACVRAGRSLDNDFRERFGLRSHAENWLLLALTGNRLKGCESS